METQNNRRKWLLATVLALLGAATLCVWGAAAAGIRFSSPPIEAAIQAFNENRAQQPDRPANNGGGGDVNISNPGGNGNGNGGGDNGDGDGNGNGNDGNGNGGGGNGAGSSGCLLGVLCLDANVNTGNTAAGGLNVDVDANTRSNNIQLDADVNTGETERCFLGLLCINSNTDASLTPRVNVDNNTAVQLNTGNATLLAADVDADLGRSNALLDTDVNVAADANLSTQSSSWLNNLLNLFVNVN